MDVVFATVGWGFSDVLAARIEADSEVMGKRSQEFNNHLLSLAAQNGNVEGVRLLPEKRADTEARDGFKETALYERDEKGREGCC